jgi:ElaB/YqjD/DUF883 family membrane-anchored ribosome-binding protein
MEASGNPQLDSANTGNRIADTVDRTSTGAHEAIDKVSDTARPAVDRLASGAHRAVDTVAGAATQANQTVVTKGSQLKNAEVQFVEDCRSYVRSNPAATVGMAVCAGFILGRLWRSR